VRRPCVGRAPAAGDAAADLVVVVEATCRASPLWQRLVGALVRDVESIAHHWPTRWGGDPSCPSMEEDVVAIQDTTSR
jgi:hypothetical protein